MNRYVDERIAFSYPEDLRCTRHRRPDQYHLRRGPFHIFVNLPEPGFWKSLFHDAGHVRQVPPGSVDPQGRPIPTHEERSEAYAGHGFQGRAKSMLSRNRSGEISGKQVDLVFRRGESRIWLRINDDRDFPLDRVDSLLESMAFPGEERYEEARRLGPIKKRVSSPYVVALRYFPGFGRKARKGRARFDVQYEGGAITDPQLRAVERLLDDEEQLYEQAKVAIFRYYTECIYPLSSQLGRHDDLWPPCRTAEDVARLVKLSGLMVHEPREDGAVPIGLRFHCSWDEEHGLGLRAAGPTIEAVGTDFTALSPQGDEWPGFRGTAS